MLCDLIWFDVFWNNLFFYIQTFLLSFTIWAFYFILERNQILFFPSTVKPVVLTSLALILPLFTPVACLVGAFGTLSAQADLSMQCQPVISGVKWIRRQLWGEAAQKGLFESQLISPKLTGGPKLLWKEQVTFSATWAATSLYNRSDFRRGRRETSKSHFSFSILYTPQEAALLQSHLCCVRGCTS